MKKVNLAKEMKLKKKIQVILFYGKNLRIRNLSGVLLGEMEDLVGT